VLSLNKYIVVKSELFKTVTINIIVFWNAKPCNLVKFYGRFEETFVPHLYDTIKKQIEVPLYYEDGGSTLLSLDQNTRRYVSKDSNLQIIPQTT
jgi:hypothetical protein